MFYIIKTSIHPGNVCTNNEKLKKNNENHLKLKNTVNLQKKHAWIVIKYVAEQLKIIQIEHCGSIGPLYIHSTFDFKFDTQITIMIIDIITPNMYRKGLINKTYFIENIYAKKSSFSLPMM